MLATSTPDGADLRWCSRWTKSVDRCETFGSVGAIVSTQVDQVRYKMEQRRDPRPLTQFGIAIKPVIGNRTHQDARRGRTVSSHESEAVHCSIVDFSVDDRDSWDAPWTNQVCRYITGDDQARIALDRSVTCAVTESTRYQTDCSVNLDE